MRDTSDQTLTESTTPATCTRDEKPVPRLRSSGPVCLSGAVGWHIALPPPTDSSLDEHAGDEGDSQSAVVVMRLTRRPPRRCRCKAGGSAQDTRAGIFSAGRPMGGLSRTDPAPPGRPTRHRRRQGVCSRVVLHGRALQRTVRTEQPGPFDVEVPDAPAACLGQCGALPWRTSCVNWDQEESPS